MTIQLHLIPDTSTEYSALFISPETFANDVLFLQGLFPSYVPNKEQLDSILEHCTKEHLKVSYCFTSDKNKVSFSAHIGGEFFSNGTFLDFDNQKTKYLI